MSARTEEIRDILTANYEDIRALFATLTDGDLDTKTGNGWPVRSVGGHIAQAPGGDVYVAKRLAKGSNATLPGFLAFVLDLSNWWGVRKFAKATRADLLAAWENGHNDLFSFATTLSDDELDRGGTVMSLGKQTAYSFLKQSPSHSQEHAEAIRAVIGDKSRA